MRGSDKHSPRLDDQLVHEVAPLVQGESDEGRTEYRSKETPGEEEGGFGYRPELDEPGPAPTEAELAMRADIARHLPPSAFPARAEELREAAARDHAPPPVMELLDRLPDDVYDTVQQVWQAVGGSPERRSS